MSGKPVNSSQLTDDAEASRETRLPGKMEKIRKLLPDGMAMSRKNLRKEMRKNKKARRNAYNNRKAAPTLIDQLKNKHEKYLSKVAADKLEEEKKERKKRKNAAKRQAKERRKEAYLKEQNEQIQKKEEERQLALDDDREIKRLEKLLHYDKRKSKSIPKAYVEDGLDYILDCIDPDKVDKLDKDETNIWGDDEDKDEEMEQSDLESGAESDEDSEVSGGEDGEDFHGDESDEDAELENGSEEAEEDMQSEEEVEFSEEDEEEGIEEGNTSDEDAMEEDSEPEGEADEDESEEVEDEDGEDEDGSGDTQELKEDIYGRLRDSKGNIVSTGVYVPPAKRRQLEEGSEARKERLNRLKKQLKGQLNRLSESNMVSIANQIESLYREQSRADMNECLRDLVEDMALTAILTPERLSLELAMLVALLHNNIGTEVGAGFLEMLADMFNALHSDSTSSQEDSKKINNVVTFLCHLYSFQVTHSVLLTDIMNLLVDSFQDKDVELILLMLKNIGFVLRKDDPVTLKDIILKVQQKANDAELSNYKDSSRVKFMLEILLAIKNNNVKKVTNYDPTHLDQLRKLLRASVKGSSSLAGGQLRITLKDLMEAKEKGKWWVVGSAWQGKDVNTTAETQLNRVTQIKPSGQVTFSRKLLELAAKQRMNTDTRRNVFCTMVSAEDYVDAFEKILRLGLNSQQEREIVVVILECCANEKTYNAYYTHLLNKFVTHHRKYLFTYQTVMWDKFKVMKALPDYSIDNLALLTAYAITEQSVPLALLKNFEFGDMNKSTVRFLKTLLIDIFKADKVLVADIFYKVGAATKLKHLKEGLELFMHHFILRKCKEKEREKLEAKVNVAENALNLNKDVAMF